MYAAWNYTEIFTSHMTVWIVRNEVLIVIKNVKLLLLFNNNGTYLEKNSILGNKYDRIVTYVTSAKKTQFFQACPFSKRGEVKFCKHTSKQIMSFPHVAFKIYLFSQDNKKNFTKELN